MMYIFIDYCNQSHDNNKIDNDAEKDDDDDNGRERKRKERTSIDLIGQSFNDWSKLQTFLMGLWIVEIVRQLVELFFVIEVRNKKEKKHYWQFTLTLKIRRRLLKLIFSH